MQKYSLTIISLSREDTFVLSVMQLSRERERPFMHSLYDCRDCMVALCLVRKH